MMENVVTQLKDLGRETYLSLSDAIKIKMSSQQFSFLKDEDEIYKWIHENSADVYYLENGANELDFVLFLSEEDAVAFKLRWA